MAKRTAAEAEVRRQFSKTARIVRKQYQTLGEAAPNSSVLAKIDPEEIIGLKEREASGYATDTKTLKRLNNWMQNIIDKELLSVDAHKRSVQNAIDTMQAQGHTWVNETNIDTVFDFLDDLRAKGIASFYSSDYLVKIFERSKERGMNDEELRRNIERWENNIEKGRAKRLYLKRY